MRATITFSNRHQTRLNICWRSTKNVQQDYRSRKNRLTIKPRVRSVTGCRDKLLPFRLSSTPWRAVSSADFVVTTSEGFYCNPESSLPKPSTKRTFRGHHGIDEIDPKKPLIFGDQKVSEGIDRKADTQARSREP